MTKKKFSRITEIDLTQFNALDDKVVLNDAKLSACLRGMIDALDNLYKIGTQRDALTAEMLGHISVWQSLCTATDSKIKLLDLVGRIETSLSAELVAWKNLTPHHVHHFLHKPLHDVSETANGLRKRLYTLAGAGSPKICPAAAAREAVEAKDRPPALSSAEAAKLQKKLIEPAFARLPALIQNTKGLGRVYGISQRFREASAHAENLAALSNNSPDQALDALNQAVPLLIGIERMANAVINANRSDRPLGLDHPVAERFAEHMAEQIKQIKTYLAEFAQIDPKCPSGIRSMVATSEANDVLPTGTRPSKAVSQKFPQAAS